MSLRSFVLCSVSALLPFAVGCDAPREAANQTGTLDVVIAATSDSLHDRITDGSITIRGLDQPLHAHVAIPSGTPRRSLELSLPAGLYGVEWQPSSLSAEAAQAPAPSAVSMVVVAAGSTSSVVLRAVPAGGIAAEQPLPTTERNDGQLALR